MIKRIGKFLIFVAIIVVLVLFNVYQNHNVSVEEYSIDSIKIPPSFESFKIVQVSDLHSVTDVVFASKLLESIKEQSPGMIVITGDLLDSTIYSEESSALQNNDSASIAGQATIDFISQIIAVAPVYFVYGNHEMVLLDDPNNNSFKVALEELGVIFANNRALLFKKDSAAINILGIQDPATLYKDPVFKNSGETSLERTKAMMDAVTKNINETLFTVLLAHRPEFFDVYSTYPVDLALTGHAHGGQMRMPFIREGLYAPNQGFFPDYTSGLYTKGSFSMIVGRGLGNSIIPFRVFNGPELVVITLTNTVINGTI